MGAYIDSLIDRHALDCARVLARSWELWAGNCEICGAVGAVGFCDRCTECAIESVYENERDFGGTSEYVVDHFGIQYPYERCARLVEGVAHVAMDYQADIWRGVRL